MAQIAESIQLFGFVNPVLIMADGTIVAGHGRYLAALMLGLKEVPTVLIDHMDQHQIAAYRIADNQLAELAGWDDDILTIEFQVLSELTMPELDLTVTGFSMAEIDRMLRRDAPEPDEATIEKLQEMMLPEPISRSGDLWVLGTHRLYCGDSLKLDSYTTLMGDERATACIVDPPYNVPINSHVTTRSGVFSEFASASGEMSPEEYTAYCHDFMQLLKNHAVNGSLHYLFTDWRHVREMSTACHTIYDELKNICVWNKDNGGMGSLYRSKHELVFVCKSGTAPHVNNIELGKHGRYRTNVWDCPGQNTFHKNREAELDMHPTVKPVQLIADIMLDCTKNADIVLDSFGGSGTTLLAAEKTGRRARLIEIEPRYVDLTIRRWQEKTGKEAIHDASGETFNERPQNFTDATQEVKYGS